MTNKKNFEIAIVGGGISGLTLGIALHSRNIPVTIYEQASHFAEIGAGVSFTSNAVQAMKHCNQGIYEAFERVRTKNLWPSKEKVWFDYHDGYHHTSDPKATHAFTISNSLGQAGVHRAHYLDQLIKLFPSEQAVFGKRLESLERQSEKEGGKWILRFHDNSTATSDAVVGCDGIKSSVRKMLYGKDDPRSYPTYTHKYAYRALADMEQAVEAVGEEKAKNSCMHMGPGGHMLTFPVQHGKILNIVAFHTTTEDWPDYNRLTRPATREDALKDFADYGHDVISLLKLCKPNLDIWAIFHLGDNPLPYFAKGTICLIGDAAHATSPHHGAGAGFCVEDSAVLSDLLADENVRTQQDIEAAFEVFDEQRRARGHFLVQTSQHIGNCYEWLADGVGDDFQKIEHEINSRNAILQNVDVEDMCRRAKEQLQMKLTSSP
ncbi:hypothetical protein CERZMDRAFT_113150 [Cercospora zeae-maydis SCOH1-5]|uniref:FAD-binding domain-containing protein n=1 Tax=Cercospora zeae-maydis SCOH1-5 TaxID=717836 RepID=A0A6A6FB36_9PEZI|nr:hypothetical protein CERZMDRAFT_113150 [Cercospora zeae-maydis SCOH1-5]